MAVAKVKAKTKAKKKRWCQIIGPKLFQGSVLGEVYVGDPAELKGRGFNVNMMNITGDPKKQNINIHFKIDKVHESNAHTYATGFNMTPGSIRRFVRRGRDRVDDSFTTKTLDGLNIRVKPMVITNGNTTKPVQSKMRLTARKVLKEIIAKYPYNNLLYAVLSAEIQRELKTKLGKIYPVRNFEVRAVKLLDDKVPEEMTMEKPKEEKKEEPKEEKPKGEEKAPAEDKKEKKPAKKEKAEVKEEAKPSEAKAPKQTKPSLANT
ncbi:hypothetical protein ACFL1B_05330, partial [Nanoarchaeota archaeon]